MNNDPQTFQTLQVGPRSSRSLALGIVAFYLIGKFGFSVQIEQLGLYASYVVEVLFIGAVLIFYPKSTTAISHFSQGRLAFEGLLSILLGIVTYKATDPLGLAIPFNLNDTKILSLLLILGPILEEALFRRALWIPIEILLKKQSFVIFTTSLLFAWGHFFAYFSFPNEWRDFIVYQTCYAFIISLWWGSRYSKTRALSVPIVLHLGFNGGFYLGFVISSL